MKTAHIEIDPELTKRATLEECRYALQKAERHLKELYALGFEDVDAEFVDSIAPQIDWVEAELAKAYAK